MTAPSNTAAIIAAFVETIAEVKNAAEMDDVQNALDDHGARIERLYVDGDEAMVELIEKFRLHS